MKAPNLPSFSDSCPLPQDGQARGSPPSALGREDVRPEQLVEASSTCVDAQVLGVVDARRRNRVQKSRSTVLPVDLAVGDLVELLLEVGGEVVFDVAREEALQERGDQPALVLGDEPLLLEPHIVAVAQHGEGRGVGRGPADAELLHALDQRRLGVARRRLGEMLARRRSARAVSGSPAVIGGRRPPSSSSSSSRPSW